MENEILKNKISTYEYNIYDKIHFAKIFFSHYIDLSKIVKNVDVERWLFKLIKKRRIENDMYTNKLTEKLLKYKQK